jgi:AcrR family transcriptional regulator
MGQKKENSRVLILKAAKELFWKHGFRRVSVEEVCKKAGVSKMTFYRFFHNKIELARSVYDMVMQEGIDEFHVIMKEDDSPEEKIRKILLLKHQGTSEISQEFLNDFYNSKELGLRDYVERRTVEAWDEVHSGLKTAGKKGLFRKDFNPEILLSVSQKMTELVNDPKVMKLYNNPHDAIMEILNIIMYGILPRK